MEISIEWAAEYIADVNVEGYDPDLRLSQQSDAVQNEVWEQLWAAVDEYGHHDVDVRAIHFTDPKWGDRKVDRRG